MNRPFGNATRDESTSAAADVPLVVDLDGTLIRTDSMLESLFVLAKVHALSLLKLPLWLAHGRARFKQLLASESMPDAQTLPYRIDLLQYLQAQKQAGRRLVLATGADERIARSISEHLGLFEQVFASDGSTNLAGAAKREKLVAQFGARGFDYAGSSWRDLAVWGSARRAILIAPTASLHAAVTKIAPVERVFAKPPAQPGLYLQELRWHHWPKNLLVFIPLFASYRFYDVRTLLQASLGFFGFCVAASSVYLLNDLADLPMDRRHPWKSQRPLASGQMPIEHAIGMLPLLWLGASAIAMALPAAYRAALAAYVLLMVAYNFRLKEIRVVDALVLGCGYTLRILAGAHALRVGVSAWLLGWSVLLFFSLALLKRYAELVMMRARREVEGHTRAYRATDVMALAIVGPTFSGIAMLILALYPIVDAAAHEARWPIWGICVLLLYWSQRMWQMAGLARIRDDPVMFAFKDRVSLMVGAIVLILIVIA